MTVIQGDAALASDYNTLRGEVNEWFADNYPALAFGNSNQTRGWGGSAASVVSPGDLMTATQMNSLIDICNIGTDVVNNVSGVLSQVVTGNLMTAAEFNAIETKSDLITTNRNDIEAAELSLVAGGSSVKSGLWSFISCTFRYTFTDFNLARHFFNSGGAANISGSITGYSTGTGWDGAGFNEILSTMGTITMDYTQTTQSGSGGSPSAYGYYDLPAGGGWQTIFTQTGSGVYTDAVLEIEGRQINSGGGGGTAYFELKVSLTPGSGRSVDGTTTITTQYRKLDNQSSGGASLTITAPVYSLINGL